MKKICIITPNVLPVPAVKGGAVETLVNNIIDENETDKNFDFTVVSIYNKEAKVVSEKYVNTKFKYINILFNDNIEKLKSKLNGKFILDKVLRKFLKINEIVYACKILCFVARQKYDYILIEGGNPFIYKKILKKFGKEKCICHLHGNISGNYEYDKYFRYFIAISKFVKKRFISNNIIDENRVFVINNGIKLENFGIMLSEKQKNDEKKKLGINFNEIVIEFCGRTIPEKGIKELVQAFKKINNINKCKLLIIGNSQFGNNVSTDFDKELIEESKPVKDKIVFTGYVHNNDLYKLYGVSDISVIPSMWEEPSGLVVMEAMASGLPIITTDSGGIPELVNDRMCNYCT